jgi:hypothetical protein
VVRKRNADEERRRIAASIRVAKREHGRGRCKPLSCCGRYWCIEGGLPSLPPSLFATTVREVAS